jgi:hypothetical protein
LYFCAAKKKEKEMKKKYPLLIILPLMILLTITACNKKKPAKKTVDKKAEKVVVDSSADLAYVDTLKLKQGDIPPGWEKVKLWEDGYFISFPKKPWKKIIYSKNRIEFHYPKKNYDTYASITDLSKERSYNDTKAQKQLFYEVVLNDLIKDMSESEDAGMKPKIISKASFQCLDLYDAMRAELKAKDVHIYVECVLIGRMLYTMSFLIWEDETPAILQIKDRFFKSFGKDLQVK